MIERSVDIDSRMRARPLTRPSYRSPLLKASVTIWSPSGVVNELTSHETRGMSSVSPCGLIELVVVVVVLVVVLVKSAGGCEKWRAM